MLWTYRTTPTHRQSIAASSVQHWHSLQDLPLCARLSMNLGEQADRSRMPQKQFAFPVSSDQGHKSISSNEAYGIYYKTKYFTIWNASHKRNIYYKGTMTLAAAACSAQKSINIKVTCLRDSHFFAGLVPILRD